MGAEEVAVAEQDEIQRWTAGRRTPLVGGMQKRDTSAGGSPEPPGKPELPGALD